MICKGKITDRLDFIRNKILSCKSSLKRWKIQSNYCEKLFSEHTCNKEVTFRICKRALSTKCVSVCVAGAGGGGEAGDRPTRKHFTAKWRSPWAPFQLISSFWSSYAPWLLALLTKQLFLRTSYFLRTTQYLPFRIWFLRFHLSSAVLLLLSCSPVCQRFPRKQVPVFHHVLMGCCVVLVWSCYE